jgi:hypothetical protein
VRTAIGMAHSAKSWGWRGAGIAAMRPARMRQHRADSETGRRWIGWIEAKAGVRFDISNPEKLWLFAPCEDPEGLAEWIAGQGCGAHGDDAGRAGTEQMEQGRAAPATAGTA